MTTAAPEQSQPDSVPRDPLHVRRRMVAVLAFGSTFWLTYATPSLVVQLVTPMPRRDAGFTDLDVLFHDQRHGQLLGVAVYLCIGLLWGQLARRLDYRWFDGLVVLIPLFGWFLMARLVWRATYRIAEHPVRDWPPASERPPRPFVLDRP